ncbi:E3 ubiquitin-protein ligase Hakai-like isoform X2 [Clarias magur]|uniref:E3 ubiquitin-protein ligase Hakai n=1 Tax=Clarias magur TaxID=1594786 RepID=A0A8J4WTQ6_CLAMG|nr:E3 ubiquitin-protein ligase Hakai-like isoform X2 [Clarias magur]
MDQNVDNDLQGTDGSGALGGPDVRRRIPIKLLSKQTLRSKPPARPQRPTTRLPSSGQTDDETFTCKQEERFECKSGDAYGKQRRFPHPFFWDFKLNLVGEKDDTPVHFCDKCGLPIKIYGRMIPCKHVFCYDCAVLYEKKSDKTCPGCTEPVQRIEQCQRGSLYMCSIVQGCKRTYLSQRDLQAHINHRHIRAGKPGASRVEPPHPTPALTPTLTSEPPDRFRLPPPPHLPKSHPLIPPPLQGHDPYGQPPPASPSPSDLGPSSRSLPPETFRIATHGAPPVSAPPPHHFNTLPQDQGTLSPPFNQPGALSPGLWPAPRVPRIQGPPQSQMPGHHPEQARYRPYYQ